MIPDCNLFMMCESLNEAAPTALPDGYRILPCRKDELDLWKGIHFDSPEEARENFDYMTGFLTAYTRRKETFSSKDACLFAIHRTSP